MPLLWTSNSMVLLRLARVARAAPLLTTRCVCPAVLPRRTMLTSPLARAAKTDDTGLRLAAEVQLEAPPTGEGLTGHCVPCTAGAPPLSPEEVGPLLGELNHLSSGLGYGAAPKPMKNGKFSARPRTEGAWQILHRGKAQADPTGAHYDPLGGAVTKEAGGGDSFPLLSKQYYFKNYVATIAFANALALLAEENGHHPQLVVEWGHVGVAWWTHAVGGLHKNDFLMAVKTDQLGTHVDGIRL